MEVIAAQKVAQIFAVERNRKKIISIFVVLTITLVLLVALVFVSVITVISGMLGISSGFRSGVPSNIAKTQIPSELLR